MGSAGYYFLESFSQAILQITMILTDNDEYQLIIHPANEKEKVIQVMVKIGIVERLIDN